MLDFGTFLIHFSSWILMLFLGAEVTNKALPEADDRLEVTKIC